MSKIVLNSRTNKYEFTAPSGRVYSSQNEKYIQFQFNRVIGEATVSAVASVMEQKEAAPEFTITKRFEILKRNIKMICAGLQKSLIITGSGGLGKSYTVLKTLAECGYTDISEKIATAESGDTISRYKAFTVVKGFSTAKGLYRELYENKDNVIVFDDADVIQKDVVAADLLKGALDSSDKRIISWKADMKDEDLPRSFLFTGRIIFISNMAKEKFAQPLISRSNVIDLKMNEEQKIERMETIMMDDDFMPEAPMEFKKDAMALIKKISRQANEISMRSLIKVTNIRMMFSGEEFEETATYTLTN